MSIHTILTRSYSSSVIYSMSKRIEDLPERYHTPVKEFIASFYRDGQIEDALYYEILTQAEFDEIMSYKYPEEDGEENEEEDEKEEEKEE